MSSPGNIDIDSRLGEILDVLLAIARQDFGVRASVGETDDTLDAIAVGLNMLAEELQGEVASRRELERAHAELKDTQGRLAHASKLAAVGHLASGVAHEINNPAMSVEVALAIVKRLCDTVQEASQGGVIRIIVPPTDLAAARAAIEDAQEAVDRIRQLTGDLRTFARTDDEIPRPVRLDEVARASCRLAGPTLAPRARLVLELGPVPPLLGSRGRLGQVVTNLLVNAAQALPEDPGGNHVIAVTTCREGDVVVLAVDDSGPGIPIDLQDKIFEPFFTTKPEGAGTGLGLALVAEITAAHGGRIRVARSTRGGARFELRFPIMTDVPMAQGATPNPATPPPVKTTVSSRLLLVDDEPLILRLMTTLLGETCTIVGAGGGAEAIAVIEGGDRAFDLILCDLHMPKIDGVAVYETVARLEPSLLERFVFTTGGAVTARSRDFLDRVQPRILAKPFPVEDLFALIRTAHPKLG